MNPEIKKIDTDVLIIGAGGAGLRAALEISQANLSCLILTKSVLGKAHTVMAEGGIAASLGDVDPQDNWTVHFADTIVEGVYIGNYRMAELLAKEAPERVYELERYGALFDRTPEGKIMQRAFGAHTYRRLCHIGDKTGLEIIRVLEDQILYRDNVKILDETVVTKLFAKNNRAIGAVAWSLREGIFYAISAKAIIVATGGLGRIYKVTSNSHESTGDGISLAFQIGARLRDMEMVQFHPTGMVWPEGVRGLLVTEGVRGEGGILLNKNGERFMLRYSPEKKELDARDVVARAIYREIIEGRGTEHGGVYLDITHKGAAFIKKKLPAMYEQFKEFAGVDITKEKMEVAPTVHYFMGGIYVDPETTATTVDGLFSAGEAASGLHGANRLGGNSLADILVFGRRAGIYAALYAKDHDLIKLDDSEVEQEVKRVLDYIDDKATEDQDPYIIIEDLRQTMSDKVGILRDPNDLEYALNKIYSLKEKAKNVRARGSLTFNQGLLGCLELNHMLLLAELIVRAAIERKESRGAHFRKDYPKKDRSYLKNIVFDYNDNNIKMSYIPVPEIPDDLKKYVKEEVYD
ncbi:MAG: succinate dehydrogenase / fumarate reductase, flavoprotein subunit [Candidatus Micrarchaeota archaeon]|nr:MAG: succinate dehydrogenase / fumarate reductase, flavoprotein subunit [Candidatus Micrarchaeota archaeon]